MKTTLLNRFSLHPAWIPALISAAGWGILPVGNRLVMNQYSNLDPIIIISSFLCLRSLASAIIIHAYGKTKDPKYELFSTFKSVIKSKDGTLKLFLLWAIILFINFWVQIYAISKIPAGLFSLLFSMNPLIGVAIATRKEKENFFVKNLLSLAFIVFGTILFCMNESFTGGAPNIWAWICFGTANFTWLTYTFLSEKIMSNGISSLKLTAFVQWINFLSTSILLISCGFTLNLITDNMEIISFACISGILSLVAINTYQIAISRSTKIALLAQYFEPVITFIAAGYLLGEHTTIIQWFAAGLSLYGLYSLMKKSENTRCQT